MKMDFKGVTCNELSFKLNNVRFNANDKVDIKPQFSRQVRRMNNNEKLNIVELSIKVESTEAEPKPFNINVTLVGIFEVEDVKNETEERKFVIDATKLLFPYLRTAVSNLTANAYVAPLYLPVLAGPIFPEDKDQYVFSVGGDSLN